MTVEAGLHEFLSSLGSRGAPRPETAPRSGRGAFEASHGYFGSDLPS